MERSLVNLIVIDGLLASGHWARLSSAPPEWCLGRTHPPPSPWLCVGQNSKSSGNDGRGELSVLEPLGRGCIQRQRQTFARPEPATPLQRPQGAGKLLQIHR